MRIKIHKTGKVTLSGIDLDNLRDILVSASEYCRNDDNAKEPYFIKQHKRVEYIYSQLRQAIIDLQRKPNPSKRNRLIMVQNARRDRLAAEAFVREIMKGKSHE